MPLKYLSILLFLFPISIMSQIQVGVKGGYNYYFIFNNESGRDRAKYTEYNDSYIFSIVARQRTSHIINLGIEFEYLHQSFYVDATWGSVGSSEYAKLNFNLGRVNFQFQPQFVFGRKYKFFFYPGLFFGKIVNSSVDGTISHWESGQIDPKVDTVHGSANSFFPWIDVGVVAGVGLDIPLYKNFNFVFENAYSYSFTGLSWGSNTSHFFNIKFEIGITYTLNFWDKKHSQ